MTKIHEDTSAKAEVVNGRTTKCVASVHHAVPHGNNMRILGGKIRISSTASRMSRGQGRRQETLEQAIIGYPPPRCLQSAILVLYSALRPDFAAWKPPATLVVCSALHSPV